MIDLGIFKGRTIAVMGLGKSGLVAAEALLAAGVGVVAWDDAAPRRAAAVARGVPCHDLAAADWSGIDSLVLSPGIPHLHPAPHPVAAAARSAGVEIIGDIELLARACPDARYIGVTGTNGKSTTTALIGHILQADGCRAEVGGNLGTPALALGALGDGGTYVLEMSSYQLEITPSANFAIAVLLNLSPDHIDRHGDMDGYVAAKRRIFEQQDPGDIAIVGVDDSHSRGLFDKLLADRRDGVVPVSSEIRLDRGVYVVDGILYDATDGAERKVRRLDGVDTLPGAHNAQNAAAAYAATRAAGIAADRVAAALATYPGLPHRQQLAAVLDGVRYVNDSKATNPEAAAKALACYDEIYWIAGGRAKEGAPDAIYPYLDRVRRAFLIGEAAEPFAEALAGRVETEHCGDLATAVTRAHRAASGRRAVILLSPACASFDQFSSFEERGDVFCRLVADLPGHDRDIRANGKVA